MSVALDFSETENVLYDFPFVDIGRFALVGFMSLLEFIKCFCMYVGVFVFLCVSIDRHRSHFIQVITICIQV